MWHLLSCVRQKKRRRVWSECEECGRRFSRMSLLKAHRQTHGGADAPSSPSSPPAGAASPLRCSRCGKRFSSATRLQSHVRTQHPEDRSWPLDQDGGGSAAPRIRTQPRAFTLKAKRKYGGLFLLGARGEFWFWPGSSLLQLTKTFIPHKY